jgi:hypothetical protein
VVSECGCGKYIRESGQKACYACCLSLKIAEHKPPPCLSCDKTVHKKGEWFCSKCRDSLCKFNNLTSPVTPAAIKRSREESDTPSQSKRRSFGSDITAKTNEDPILSQISNCSTLLEEFLNDISKESCLDLMPQYDENWEFPEIPEGLRNQRIFAYPAQLRRRNVNGNAVVAGIVNQPIFQLNPVLAAPSPCVKLGGVSIVRRAKYWTIDG